MFNVGDHGIERKYMNTSPKMVLVCGGAGYIGSHTVQQLLLAGFRVVVLDNLSRGHSQALDGMEIHFVQGNIGDIKILQHVFQTYPIEAVLHFAGYTYVGDSVKDPITYYQNNLVETISLLNQMIQHHCKKFVFSSTCSTYGIPQTRALREDHSQHPINPYGKTKFMVEQILEDYDTAYALKYMSLRYFNASGASSDGTLGEDHRPETHLIPLVLRAIQGKGPELTVFGNDYDTPDGTCIRDYIHVEDLAEAHILALQKLFEGADSNAYNLGTEKGFSVLDILKTAEQVTGKPVPHRIGARREGDPACLIADASKAYHELGWKPKRSELSYILETAWRWYQTRSQYED